MRPLTPLQKYKLRMQEKERQNRNEEITVSEHNEKKYNERQRTEPSNSSK